ncbi:Ger(x)C family spore germination protein [Paenibacillus radicis (ex Xue et al. 2023)]|uniref:Ger(X)C family spore germination protein n=1 Tax=Paenibacillus radicis (ex Xue et al. 2023) TaxID=2972489 RepID=A0ABT1YMK0_9BACL|nr:Ger(x)C family spore germination protein [Paenibacillus radicis (ex Xue et al. 2023)]MCR8634396.1 Ger(x)C family spore germination protein [Paenibacillus radicis (ex Xue et al. 2023)]
MLRKRTTGVGLLLALWCLLILTGCWSRVEINDRAFVTAIYVDRLEDGDYELSIGFPLPNRIASGGGSSTGLGSSGGGGGNPYTIVTKKAESIAIALRLIRSDLSREISWGHCRVIVVGRKMAESGVNPILEFVAREPNFHTKSYFMVAPNRAREISYLTPVFERLPAEVLREFAKRKVTLDTSIKDFLESAATDGDTAAAMLTIGDTEMLSEKGKKSTWVGTDGAAIFRKDKMIGTFDVKEMRAWLWLKGKMRNAMISLKSPTDGKTISFIILSSKAAVHPVVQGGKIRFNISVEAEDDIMSSESNIDLTNPEQILKVQNMLSRQLKGRIQHAIRKSQNMGADVFGFGRLLNWNYPNVWKEHEEQWLTTYKKVEFNVDAKVNVKRTGTEKNPIIRQFHR